MGRWILQLKGMVLRMTSRRFDEELPKDPNARARVLQQFAGLWVAIDEDRLIAAEPTLDALYRRLDDIEKPMATVRRIPDPKQGVFVA